MRGRVDEESLG